MVESILPEQLERLPLFPLPGAVLFPGMRMPLHIFEPRYRQMVQDARAEGRPIAIGNLKADEEQTAGMPAVYPVLGVGVLKHLRELPDGRFLIELVGKARLLILDEVETTLPYREVRAQVLLDEPAQEPAGTRAIQILRSVLGLLRKSAPDLANGLAQSFDEGQSPGEIAFSIAGSVHTDAAIRQAWLQERDPVARLVAVTDALSTLVAQAQPARGMLN